MQCALHGAPASTPATLEPHHLQSGQAVTRLLPAATLVCCLTACTAAPPEESNPSAPQTHRFRGDTMGSTYEVTVVADPLDDARLAALDTAVAEALARIDAAMSTWRPESELNRFNRAETTDPFPVSAETATVFEHALAVSALTGGAFDVTVGTAGRCLGIRPARASPRRAGRGRPHTPPRAGRVGTVGGGRCGVNHPEALARRVGGPLSPREGLRRRSGGGAAGARGIRQPPGGSGR